MRLILAVLLALTIMPASTPPPVEAGTSPLYDRTCMKVLKYRGVSLAKREARCRITRDVLAAPHKGPTPTSIANDTPDALAWNTGDALYEYHTRITMHRHWAPCVPYWAPCVPSAYTWVIDDFSCGINYYALLTLDIKTCDVKKFAGGTRVGATYTTMAKIPILDMPIVFGYHSFAVFLDQTDSTQGRWFFDLGRGAY